MKVSLVLNCDTRAGFLENNSKATEILKGCVSQDFITDGLLNNIRFFEGFDLETIIYIDQHQEIPEEVIRYVRSLSDVVIIRNHTNENLFNDWNYVRALQMASGDIVFHIDQDTATFTSSKECVQELIDLLETYDYISYPSHWSPKAVDDPSFDYMWVSTRFFICKREALDFNEIKKCLTDYDYMFSTYPASRQVHWTEHVLGLLSKYKGKGVYYPKIELDKLAIFSWGSYEAGLLKRLNEMAYEDVKKFVESKGINYPNDLYV